MWQSVGMLSSVCAIRRQLQALSLSGLGMCCSFNCSTCIVFYKKHSKPACVVCCCILNIGCLDHMTAANPPVRCVGDYSTTPSSGVVWCVPHGMFWPAADLHLICDVTELAACYVHGIVSDDQVLLLLLHQHHDDHPDNCCPATAAHSH